jgi:hypothetical protein
MDCIAIGSTIQIENSKSPITFEAQGGGNWKVWDRFLCIEGKQAFHIGNICGTCSFFFERLYGANQKISAREVSVALRQGLQSLDSDAVLKLQQLLPVGKFTPVLWHWKPSLVTPGLPADYFVKEQIDLWGVDGFWGLPHNPMTEYYRTPKARLDKDAGLFHFGIPIYPHRWLKRETLDFYRNQFGSQVTPTAVSISVLDVKQPTDWKDSPEFNKHFCFAHYLIDGHHKTYAAASSGSAGTLLSFVAHDKGISSHKDFEKGDS